MLRHASEIHAVASVRPLFLNYLNHPKTVHII
jgi:hypothetical protein